jgi:hypothetical protein
MYEKYGNSTIRQHSRLCKLHPTKEINKETYELLHSIGIAKCHYAAMELLETSKTCRVTKRKIKPCHSFLLKLLME